MRLNPSLPQQPRESHSLTRAALASILISALSACGDCDVASNLNVVRPTEIAFTMVGRYHSAVGFNSLVGTVSTATHALDLDAARQPVSCNNQGCNTLQVAGNQVYTDEICRTPGIQCTPGSRGITTICFTRQNPNDSVIIHNYNVNPQQTINGFAMCANNGTSTINHITCQSGSICITN